ncbi:hypothetical protein J21TS3_11860 [Paenibacillus cookii]|uniref:HpaB/PvcC/4-BUDH N-terminal domain-containing protein n=1 Tax=Paenibacillus cookii TaxID=157839 RepID=A0ABQ4LSX5_9BACL|nr:hypothetical protein J21TS3_11860 [Paenibacillus cookii]
MTTQAELYDLQHHPDYRERMTYCSPSTGDAVGLSFKQPVTKDDLAKRREMMTLWGERHHGLLGRSPDYMNTGLMILCGRRTAWRKETRICGSYAGILRLLPGA